MRKTALALFLACFLCFLVSPCHSEEKEWTFMVFLNADNDLDPFSVEDQFEMSKVIGKKNLNIVTLIDRAGIPARMNYIGNGSIDKIKDMGELDMGDYRVMVSFVKEVVARYPAKHYVLDIWNHGSGWRRRNNRGIFKGISYDDSSENHITTGQLGIALSEIKTILGKNLDILSMDACLMQMMEVGYQIRKSVDLIVASEETVPGLGYPYNLMLGGLTDGMKPVDLAKKMVEAYTAYYSSICDASTLSVVAAGKLDALNSSIEALARAVMTGDFCYEVQAALAGVQRYSLPENIDLLHFVKLLKGSIRDKTVLEAAGNLEKAFSEAVLANGVNATGYEGPYGERWPVNRSLANSCGMAIYFPENPDTFLPQYSELEFSRDCAWDEMFQDYFRKAAAKAILDDLNHGDFSSLQTFTQPAGSFDRETADLVYRRVSFALFTERSIPSACQGEARRLLDKMRAD